MKRIVDDPDRMKRCSKCGEPRRASDYHLGTNGYPTPECKPCHAVRVRGDYRARYARDAGFRTAEKKRATAKNRARYWRARPLDTGRAVRICNCHGKVCRLWLVDDTIRCAVSARALTRFRVSAA